ncbi:lipase 3 [Stomoxys calcitrans]|uniref:lipase 3 n=1 Tax=Stomoxys calcitrans TaxID=35570 RepID=UPI0027E320DB|nr:lipase 3 [Stomoxys calcitrans]
MTIHFTFLDVFLIFFVLQAALAQPIQYDSPDEKLMKTTADRIKEHGYPAEIHYVETEDNYVIGMFRIPYSHNLQNQNEPRPAILLQHGLTSCSDAWILNGPNDALAFLLADAGYDVWMGNARGNTYSRNNTRLSTNHPYFWRFSWHEIGVIDIAAMIDHILTTTGETAIHYTGHSQGTTVFFVLMSEKPEYNEKIKTAHLLAPVAFMGNMKTLWAKYTRRFIGRPNTLTGIVDTTEVMHATFFEELYNILCTKHAVMQFMCKNLIHLLNGDNDVGNMNQTVVGLLDETHPAGASSTQVLHYMQEYESKRFCQLDHGVAQNRKKYGRDTPPDYDVAQITSTLFFYYSDADTLADVIDVEHLASLVPKSPTMTHFPGSTMSHGEFAWHVNVKEMVNMPIINACNEYENSVETLNPSEL